MPDTQKILALIGMYTAIHEKAAADRTIQRAAQVAAERRIPETVAALLENQLIHPRNKAAAETALTTHEGTIALLEKLATRTALRKQASDAPVAIGSPEPLIKAGAAISADDRFTERMLALKLR